MSSRLVLILMAVAVAVAAAIVIWAFTSDPTDANRPPGVHVP